MAAWGEFQASEPLNYRGASIKTPPSYADTWWAIASQGPAVQATNAAVQLGGKLYFCQILAENAIFRYGFHLVGSNE